MAGDYPCNQITLLAHMAPDEMEAIEHNGYVLNDIWGWTDAESGKEYALVGLVDGVAFVDISTPTSPVFLGKLPEPESANNAAKRVSDIQHGKSTWRDIKTYKDHAFIVSDLNAAHGMQVFDLTKLRALDGSTPSTFSHDQLYTDFGSAHNIAINEETGYAFVTGMSQGGTLCSGGLHIINIQDPKNPMFVGCFDEDGYTHDAQCVVYDGTDTDYQGKSICFNSNEDTFTIANLEDPENPVMISRNGYSNATYSHQGWLTEDHKFFLMNDELDEDAFGHNAKTLVWNIADLDAPELIGSYVNNAPSIDHNLYIHQNMVYESNYLSGLRVLGTDSIASGKLRELAFFDTYPQGDGIHFGGAWSNYPYFESGTIIVSDMNNGLFLLKLNLQEEQIIKMPGDAPKCMNEDSYELTVETKDNLTYQWQWFNGFVYGDLAANENYSGTTTPTLTIMLTEATADLRYRCKITNTNGELFYTYLADSSKMQPYPVADFTISTTEEGFTQFTNSSKNAVTYFWDFGDGNTSTEENPSHQFEYGTFEVTLIVYSSCGENSVTKTAHIVTGTAEQSKSLRLYPNPAGNYVNIYSERSGKLSIYALSGELIKSFPKEAGIEYFRINELGKGFYIIKVSTNEGTVSKVLRKI